MDRSLKNKILVVDDDVNIREILSVLLKSEGYKVMEAGNGVQAVKTINHNKDIDLVIMDVMMPGMSGFEACNLIRDTSQVPILFLTAKSQESDKEEGYLQGGDDYLVKPFSETELLIKVKSLIRRYKNYYYVEETPNENMITDNIELDLEKEGIIKNNKFISLTDKEFKILLYFMEHRGETIKNKDIYESVWNSSFEGVTGNTIMVHILNLRKKIEIDASKPTIIKTIWGKGYRLD